MAPRRVRVVKKSKGVANANQISNMISRALTKRAEHKFFDSTVSSNIGTSYTINALTQNIVQGITGATRIGDNIRLASLVMKARIGVGSGATSTDVRVIVVLDKMNVGVAPVAGDLLVNSGVTSTYSAEQIKEKRFTILYDRINNVNTGGRNTWVIQKSFNLNQTVEFNGTANAVTDNGKNSMWVFTVSTDNINKPGFNMDFQIQFTDL